MTPEPLTREQVEEWFTEETACLNASDDFEGPRLVLITKLRDLALQSLDRRWVEKRQPACGWLIIRTDGTREAVAGFLTDEVFMDEGDEAWPMYSEAPLPAALAEPNAAPQAQDNVGDGSDAPSQAQRKPASAAPNAGLVEKCERTALVIERLWPAHEVAALLREAAAALGRK